MKRTLAIAAAAAVCMTAVGAVAHAPAYARSLCHVPRLTSLTLAAARARARHAGCELRVKGAALKEAAIQTVARQFPGAGRRAAAVTVLINPLCFGSAARGPDLEEPLITPGPTELISGFYLEGGPVMRFSAPGCRLPAPPPQAGTVEVIDAATGVTVATQSSVNGKFVEIPLAAGTYTIVGTFLEAAFNGSHPTQTESITIPPGHSLREDFFLSVP
jgi:hypothetical protein